MGINKHTQAQSEINHAVITNPPPRPPPRHHPHPTGGQHSTQQRATSLLTDDVVVVLGLELVAPEVRRELLELDGETALPRGLVTRQHDVGRAHHLAAVRLLPRRHEVELVELVLRRGPGRVQRGADEVQPVPDLRVENVALIVSEPGGRQVGRRGRKLGRRVK